MPLMCVSGRLDGHLAFLDCMLSLGDPLNNSRPLTVLDFAVSPSADSCTTHT